MLRRQRIRNGQDDLDPPSSDEEFEEDPSQQFEEMHSNVVVLDISSDDNPPASPSPDWHASPRSLSSPLSEYDNNEFYKDPTELVAKSKSTALSRLQAFRRSS